MIAPQPAEHDHTAALIVEHWEMVLRICTARLTRPVDAEDATQETFLRFVEADLADINNVQAWLATVALRVCARALGRRYRIDEVPLSPQLPATSHADPTEEVLDEIWFQCLAETLPKADRFVLAALFVRRIPRAQVAQQLGVSRAHLRVIAHRARQRAKDSLNVIGLTVEW